MSDNDKTRAPVETAQYIRENFQPDDRLAVVLINKRADAVIQRLASAEKMVAPDFLVWLHRKNAEHYDVYLSMNALQPYAQSRTKGEVATIRHVYLDLDKNGSAAVETLLKREDLPNPNYVINTSPDKWQVVWKVSGFDKRQAEELQKGLARECGADPAATDCARVLRVPGFCNCKYASPFMVRAETIASDTYGADRFPKFVIEDHVDHEQLETKQPTTNGRTHPSGSITQSERDWAFAKRALARGESPLPSGGCYRQLSTL